jgi:hypothetical protein
MKPYFIPHNTFQITPQTLSINVLMEGNSMIIYDSILKRLNIRKKFPLIFFYFRMLIFFSYFATLFIWLFFFRWKTLFIEILWITSHVNYLTQNIVIFADFCGNCKVNLCKKISLFCVSKIACINFNSIVSSSGGKAGIIFGIICSDWLYKQFKILFSDFTFPKFFSHEAN